MTFRAGWLPKYRNQVVVESFADGAFVRAVGAAHGLSEFDFTTPLGPDSRPIGKDGFRKHLTGMRAFVQRGLVTSVAIIGDCDDSHAGSFVSIRRAVQDAGGYPTPTVTPGGVASSGKLPRVGILMLPGPTENGCLETLLLKSTLRRNFDQACLEQWIACCGFPDAPRSTNHKFRVRGIISATVLSAPEISLSDVWNKTDCPFDPADSAFTWVADFLRETFA